MRPLVTAAVLAEHRARPLGDYGHELRRLLNDLGAFAYGRLPDADRTEVAWIMDGVDPDEAIGDFGLVGGGAVFASSSIA